jgi:hypothetical protein
VLSSTDIDVVYPVGVVQLPHYEAYRFKGQQVEVIVFEEKQDAAPAEAKGDTPTKNTLSLVEVSS